MPNSRAWCWTTVERLATAVTGSGRSGTRLRRLCSELREPVFFWEWRPAEVNRYERHFAKPSRKVIGREFGLATTMEGRSRDWTTRSSPTLPVLAFPSSSRQRKHYERRVTWD